MGEKTSLIDAPIFLGLDDDERTKLRRLVTEVGVKAGKLMASQGSIGREFGVILDGAVSVRRDGEEIAQLSAGEFFGEMALLDDDESSGRERNADVVALTDVRAAVMSAGEFHELMASMPSAAETVSRAVIDRRL